MRRISHGLVPSLSLLLAGPAAAADFDHALVIVVDDLGTDKVGAYAGDADAGQQDHLPDTATLDLLASAGVRFTDAWAAPMCSPTRAVLYSGEYSYRNGVGTVISEGSRTKLGSTQATFAKVAADSGVRAGLYGKWHVGETATSPDAPTATPLVYKEYPVQLGFYAFAGNMEGEVDSYTNWLYTVSKPATSNGTSYRTTATQLTTNATDQLTSDALAFMNGQSAAGKRRITVASYNLPHATRSASNAWTWADAASACGTAPSADEAENFRIATECVDAEIRQLLEATPDLEDTLVVFMGDNGTEAAVAEGNADDGRGKSTVYETGVRVPFIVADGAAVAEALAADAPPTSTTAWRIGAGAEVTDPSHIVDIYATLTDFLALSSTSCTVGVTCARDSRSLRSVLTGGAPLRDDVWTETFSGRTGSYTGSAALRAGDMKLVVKGTSTCRRYELYDLGADRWEQVDLFDDPAYAAEQADLLDRLAAHEADMTVDWLADPECTN